VVAVEVVTAAQVAQVAVVDSVESHSTYNLVKLSLWLWVAGVAAASAVDLLEVAVPEVAVIPEWYSTPDILLLVQQQYRQ